MADQIQIAHSAGVMGAAMIAGGLYGCAVEDVTSDGVIALASQALSACTTVPFMLDDAKAYKKTVDKLAAKGWIDPPSNLDRARLYFFTGGSDRRRQFGDDRDSAGALPRAWRSAGQHRHRGP